MTGLVAVVLLLTACGRGGGQAETGAKRSIELAPASMLSEQVRQAAPEVQDAYRFAFANKELLEQVPCYCGCVAMGHESNYDCYVDDHALG